VNIQFVYRVVNVQFVYCLADMYSSGNTFSVESYRYVACACMQVYVLRSKYKIYHLVTLHVHLSRNGYAKS